MPQTIEIVKNVPLTGVVADLENLLSKICNTASIALNAADFPALTVSGTPPSSTLDAASLGGKPAAYYDIAYHSINDLNDVDTSSVANGHILKWDSLAAQWKTEAAVNNLDDLLDVVITAPANRELLVYDSSLSRWVNSTPGEAGVAVADHNHDSTYLGISATAVNSDKLDNQDGTYYLNWNNLTNKPTTYTPSNHGNSAHTSVFITASDVTYENLSANGDVGTGSTQVAKGNHTHSVWDVVIEDQKTEGTNGGTFTSGVWQTRDLNTLAYNSGTLASLSSNRFTLPAGTYCIDWDAPAGEGVGKNKTRLYNYTASSVVAYGRNAVNASSSCGTAVVTVSKSTSFRIEHRCETTVSDTGLGAATGWGTEVYTRVRVRKIA